MEHKNRGIGGYLVDFVQRGHAALGKLELRPPTDDAHPLIRWGPLCLLL